MEILENDSLIVKAKSQGAELCSIIRKSDGREFLWQADPKYWKRYSPVLFPIVGALWNNKMHQDDETYIMTQHGFARDSDFELLEQTHDTISYVLRANENTLRHYPYNFELKISYRLIDETVKVMWQVRNLEEKRIMHFQIGAHPAFNYMDYDPEAERQGYIKFDSSADTYKLSVIGQKGCLASSGETLKATDGTIRVNRHTFDHDAIILEKRQVQSVTLISPTHEPYLRVAFNAPVVGIWSPAHGSFAPFVCIEPWYGRCDREDYEGEFSDKEWMQHLKPGAQFNAEYLIDIL